MRKQPNSDYCFICGMKNVGGVHVAFYEGQGEDGRAEVTARFTGQDEHQGYPGRMHGGVISGILDETIGRAINIGDAPDAAVGSGMVWGVTIELNVQFHKPVPLGVELSARGRIDEEQRRLFIGSGELYLPDGVVAATATGKYVKLALNEISDVDPESLGWRVVE